MGSRVLFLCIVALAAAASAGARSIATPGVTATEIHLGRAFR